ncbi:MAG: hypothetical protein GY937_21805 [bacterium]|nr:hypothetical protein [bacterium]
MANRRRLAICALAAALFAGCNQTLSKDDMELPDNLEFFVYSQGRIVESGPVDPTHPFVQEMQAWLDVNRGGWRRDWNSYAPGIRLSAGSFSVVLSDDGTFIVLNIPNAKGVFSQLSRSVVTDQAREFVAAAKLNP